MKSAKQNYITIGSDGTVLPQGAPRAAAPVPADVAYRLARMAEEAAASLPIAPNAHDAADAADYTAVPRALATAAPRTPKGAGGIDAGSKPVALVMARPKTAKRLMQAVGDAGFAACAVYTQDHRGDSHIKLAQSAVSLGEKYSDALFCNGHAVLTAIDSCGASVVLLCDEALPLAEVDSFLARTAARGVRVFRPLSNDAPLLGWVLCTTDKPAIDGDSWRACPHCGLKFDGPSLAAGHYVCPACGGYLRMSSSERIDDLLDADSFVEWNRTVPETDPLEFPGYLGKLEAQREKTGLEEGVRTGVGRIAGLRVAIGIMESQFFMGSMGSVVGEKVARLVERATDERFERGLLGGSHGLALGQLSIWNCSCPALNDIVKPEPETLIGLVRSMQIQRLPALLASIQPTDWSVPQAAVDADQVMAALLVVVPPVPDEATVLPADCVPAQLASAAVTGWRP